MSRKPSRSAISLGLAIALVIVSAVIWLTPNPDRNYKGLSTLQSELITQTARANDLAGQVKTLTAKLQEPSPPDDVQRANDLKTQLDAVQAQLTTALGEKAKLQIQIDQAQASIAALRNSNKDLTVKVQNPKGYTPPPVTANMTKAQILQARNLFGLYTAQSPFSYAEFDSVEGKVDRKANISGYFQDWAHDFRADAVQAAWSRNQIPLMTWESQNQVGQVGSNQPDYSLSKIINGSFDPYLKKYADDIVANGMPLIIRFDHEMNGNISYYPWGTIDGSSGKQINGNTYGEYPVMWRHVWDIFQAEGANNYVIWLWSPNRVNQLKSQPEPINFYPGDQYVDWVGMSAYYRYYDSTATFAESYGKTLPYLRKTGKPIFLSETGATEVGGKKSVFLKDMFNSLALPANQDIIGLAWFNLSVAFGSGDDRVTNDWRIDSSPQSIATFAAGLKQIGWGQ